MTNYMRLDTEERCHCGAHKQGSDHCPICGCEEFEQRCDHIHIVDPTYLVIHGNHTSTKTAVDYVAHIVYGNPRIEAVTVGSKFVALVEFPGSQGTQAQYTFERMGSFPHGACMAMDKAIALREFGSWIYHYAPGTVVGNDAV
jgi:hypothetical protein